MHLYICFTDSFAFTRANAESNNCIFLDQGYVHAFTIDWGTVIDPSEGFLNSQNKLTFRIVLDLVYERTRVPLNHNPKKVTGMVGLENLGATCYLNALLQVLLL